MIFNEIKENDALIARLRNNIKNQKLAHAYILEGEKEANKLKFALGFAKEIFCYNETRESEVCISCQRIESGNHPDISIISHDGIAIKDEELLEVQKKLSTAPMIENYNIIIIDGADSITVRAQNRILKTLEDPQTASIIMLLSENSENLIQTISSRCLTLRINVSEIEKDEETLLMEKDARTLMEDIIKAEPFYKLMQRYEDCFTAKKYVAIMLDEMEKYCSKSLKEAVENGYLEEMAEAISLLERARQDLRIGVKPSYAMKNLILQLEDII